MLKTSLLSLYRPTIRAIVPTNRGSCAIVIFTKSPTFISSPVFVVDVDNVSYWVGFVKYLFLFF